MFFVLIIVVIAHAYFIDFGNVGVRIKPEDAFYVRQKSGLVFDNTIYFCIGTKHTSCTAIPSEYSLSNLYQDLVNEDIQVIYENKVFASRAFLDTIEKLETAITGLYATGTHGTKFLLSERYYDYKLLKQWIEVTVRVQNGSFELKNKK